MGKWDAASMAALAARKPRREKVVIFVTSGRSVPPERSKWIAAGSAPPQAQRRRDIGGRSFRPGAAATKTASGGKGYFCRELICFAEVRTTGSQADIPAQAKVHNPASALQDFPSLQAAIEEEACFMCCVSAARSNIPDMRVSCA